MTRSVRQLVDRFYEIVNGSEGDFAEIFVNDFELDIMKGFAFGGIHKGLGSVNKFFEDFGAYFDGWAVDTDRFIEIDSENLIVTGKYRSRALATGKDLEMETVHFWTAKNGMLTSYKHYCDTGILCGVLDHKIPQY